MTPETGTDPSSRRKDTLLFGALGVIAAVVSMVVPLSYDEGNWLVDVRRWSAGESLYSDIPENKTPLLLVLVRVLDWLPGPFTLARAFFLGVVVFVLAVTVRSLANRLGAAGPTALRLGLIAGSAAAMQSVFTLNFELPAVLLVVVGLNAVAGGHAIAGGVIAGAASTFDVRTLVLLPGLAFFGHAMGGLMMLGRTVGGMVSLAGPWVAAVLLIPELRYSLLELNIATRAATTAWGPLDTAYAALRGAAFPLGGALALTSSGRGASRRRAGIALLVGGAGIALASLQPFDKYWALALPGIVVVACTRTSGIGPAGSKRWVVVAAVGLAVSGTYAVTSNLDQRELVDRYEVTAAALADSLATEATFVRFDTQPFLGVFLSGKDRTPSAVLDFVVADSSRQRDQVSRFESAIIRATAVVDDGALSVPEKLVDAPYRRLWRVFQRHLASFPCIRSIAGLTIRYRESACPVVNSTG